MRIDPHPPLTQEDAMYKAIDTAIYYSNDDADDLRAFCHEAGLAAKFLNQSAQLNDQGHYTLSARAIYKAECLSGFRWVD
jgi:hypothetical protein